MIFHSKTCTVAINPATIKISPKVICDFTNVTKCPI